VHTVETEESGRSNVILATGELDAFAAPDLESAFLQIHGARHVLVDLARVSFMDSTALGVVVKNVRELAENGAELQVVLPNGSARRIFEITTLDRALPVAETRDEALAALAAD
jgi:anti-sigma B factor antagonist